MKLKVVMILALVSISLVSAGCLTKESVVTNFVECVVAGDFAKAGQFGAYPYDVMYNSEDAQKRAMSKWAEAMNELKGQYTYIESLNVTKTVEEDSKLLAKGEVVIVNGTHRITSEATVHLSLIQGLGWKVTKVAIDTKNIPDVTGASRLVAVMNGRYE